MRPQGRSDENPRGPLHHHKTMRILRESDEAEMVAVFLQGELSSERFGAAVRDALRALGEPERLLTNPDLRDEHANQVREAALAVTRGYGADRELRTARSGGPLAHWRAAHGFPPLILAGPNNDDLVCLEGNVRLTAHALAGFPIEAECLVGTARALKRWAQ
jgi:hypothetical protein